MTKQFLKIFPKYENAVSGRNVSNKLSATKNNKELVIAKRTLSAKVLYIVFSGEAVAIQMPVKKGKSVTAKYYRELVLKKQKKKKKKTAPSHGF